MYTSSLYNTYAFLWTEVIWMSTYTYFDSCYEKYRILNHTLITQNNLVHMIYTLSNVLSIVQWSADVCSYNGYWLLIDNMF